MQKITYIHLFKDSFSLFFRVLKVCFILFFAIGLAQSLYKAVGHFFIQESNINLYILTYNSLVKPLFILILIIQVSQFFAKEKLYDLELIYANVKRCYLKFILYYFIISVCIFLIGGSASILVYMLVFLKLPFVEASMYFNNASTLSAMKYSHEKTQGKILRYMMILLFLFLVIRILSFRFFAHFWHNIGIGDIGGYINDYIFNICILMGHVYFICLYRIIHKK